MVGVITAMGGEVERDRETLLSGGEVAPIERVRLGRGGESGVLPDRPGLVDVHRRVGPADERRLTRERVQRIPVGFGCGAVGGDVDRLDVDVFWRVPNQLV